MITLRRYLALAALSLFAAGAQAQVVYTNSNTGTAVLLNSPSYTAVETFTGFSSLSSVTWTLTNELGSALNQNFAAYVAVWNTSTNAVVGSLTNFGSAASLNTLGTGTITFNSNWTAPDSTLTYALLLSDVGGADGTYAATFGTNPGGTFFGSGGAGSVTTSAESGSFLADLQGGLLTTGIDSGSAYTMSVTGIASTPVPEPKEAAAEIALLFVAILVGRQIWLRRKSTAAAPAI